LTTANQRIDSLDKAAQHHEEEVASLQRATRSLTEQLDSAERALQISGVGYSIWDSDLDRDIFVSEDLARMHGMSAKDYLKKIACLNDYVALVAPADKQSYIEYEQSSTESQLGESEVAEYCIELPDGEVKFLRQTSQEIPESKGSSIKSVVAIQDITKQKTTELKIRQATNLITLGEMSSGAAHELNQPLAIIQLASENILRKIDSDQVAHSNDIVDRVERIKKQVARAADIVEHMRTFGSKHQNKPGVFDARKAVSGALKMKSEQLKLSGVEILVTTADSPLMISGVKARLEQVLVNLLSNALFAIEERGVNIKRIDIEAGSNIHNEVAISVRDTGGGIPSKSLARIFEPFHTTKEAPEYSGLGLSISYGLVNEMGGRITASNIQDGAQIEIIFPQESGISATPY